MSANTLQSVAQRVIHRAQEQGHVIARDVREELNRAGIACELWKDVLALSRASLSYRSGRYYYSAPVSERVRAAETQQLAIRDAIVQIIDHQRECSGNIERREHDRIEFVQPVKVIAEDGREFTLLTRDLSTTGVRLIGTRRLLGQKVRVFIPLTDATLDFVVRILWTCPVGDDLVENGGSFLSVRRSES